MVKSLHNWIFVLAVGLLSLPSAAWAASELPMDEIVKELGGSLRYGAGRTNGESFPIAVITLPGDERAFVDKVVARFAGRFTVTVDQSHLGPVVSIADIYSAQCSTCAKPHADPLVNLRNAMFFHITPGPQGVMVMGMPGKAHVAAGRPAGFYFSESLGELSSYLELKVQNLYRFEHSEVQTGSGILRSDVETFIAAMTQRLSRAGLRPLTGFDQTVDRPQLKSGAPFQRDMTWRSDTSVVSLRIYREPGIPQTQVEIYETSNQ